MEKAGLIDEMVGDAIDGAVDGEDIEEEMDEQINQVLDEIAGDTLAALPNARFLPWFACFEHTYAPVFLQETLGKDSLGNNARAAWSPLAFFIIVSIDIVFFRAQKCSTSSVSQPHTSYLFDHKCMSIVFMQRIAPHVSRLKCMFRINMYRSKQSSQFGVLPIQGSHVASQTTDYR
eukprot:1160900-Pelagomonas_calceolata.AAC.2